MDLPRESGEGNVTRAQDAAVGGGPQTAAQFLPLAYNELLRLARARMGRARPGETLTPTELVHEAYLRMAGGQTSCFESRRHFFFSASRAMRDVTVEIARRKTSLKRGGDYLRVELEEAEIVSTTPRENVMDLDRALSKLKRERPDRAQVVDLRYFGGLTEASSSTLGGMAAGKAQTGRCQMKANDGNHDGGAGYSGPLLERGQNLMDDLENPQKVPPRVQYDPAWAWGPDGVKASSPNHEGNAWTIEAARAAKFGTPEQFAKAKDVLLTAYYPRELAYGERAVGIWSSEMLDPDNHTHQQLSATMMGRVAAWISKDSELLKKSGELLCATAALLKTLASPAPHYYIGSPGMRSPGKPLWYWGTAWLRQLMHQPGPMPQFLHNLALWNDRAALALRALRYLQLQGDDLGGASAATDISKSKLKYKVTVYRGQNRHLAVIEKPQSQSPGNVCDWVEFPWLDEYKACSEAMQFGLNWSAGPPDPPAGAQPIQFPTWT